MRCSDVTTSELGHSYTKCTCATSLVPRPCFSLPCSLGMRLMCYIVEGTYPTRLELLGECRTLWGEREQAKHCGIELLCT